MLAEIFENKSMPFYKFGETHFLNKINELYWIEYICRQFSATGKSISNELSARIAAMMENHPYFVQMFAKNVWQNTDIICSLEVIDLSTLKIAYHSKQNVMKIAQLTKQLFIRKIRNYTRSCW